MRQRKAGTDAAAETPTKGSFADAEDDGELESSSIICKLLLGFIALVVSVFSRLFSYLYQLDEC